MKKRVQIINIIVSIVLFSGCIGEPTNISQVSLNLKESKTNKVFVSEYEVSNISQYIPGYKFPITAVWEELPWEIVRKKHLDIPVHILDSSANHLVFEIVKNDSFFSNCNYTEGKWLLSMDSTYNYAGSTSGMLNCLLINEIDSVAYFTIYKLKTPTEININRTRLFSFTVKKKK
jgi:hypothetical protein